VFECKLSDTFAPVNNYLQLFSVIKIIKIVLYLLIDISDNRRMKKKTKRELQILARSEKPDWRVNFALYQKWRRARMALGMAVYRRKTPEEYEEYRRTYQREYRRRLRGRLRGGLTSASLNG
jgi:ABC-type anion transport system duplicated permease subunit